MYLRLLDLPSKNKVANLTLHDIPNSKFVLKKCWINKQFVKTPSKLDNNLAVVGVVTLTIYPFEKKVMVMSYLFNI